MVDDEPDLREILAQYLRRHSFVVETAIDGIEGLQKLERTANDSAAAFDLLITDLDMPNLDGVELIHAIRSRRLPVRIIACSSTFANETLEEFKTLSVDATLPKFSLSKALLPVVDRVMRRSE